MGTKNNPGAYDCYANAEPDEPMFILLGRDVDAPVLVWMWARLRKARGEDAAKIEEAESCALKMGEWLRARGKEETLLTTLNLALAAEIEEIVLHYERQEGK